MSPLLFRAGAEKFDCNLCGFFQNFALIELRLPNKVLELLRLDRRSLILHINQTANPVIEKDIKNLDSHNLLLFIIACI